MELRFDENFYKRLTFIYLHGFVQRLLDKNFVDDVDASRSIVKDIHNRLHFGGAKKTDQTMVEQKIKTCADLLSELHDFAADRNIPFLYIQAPDKVSPHSNDFPRGITNDVNIHLDILLKQLSEKYVPFMDLREEIEKDNLDWYSLHYRTDHHWRVETAFWAHTKVIERLNTDHHFDLDPQGINRDLNSYDKISLRFLGTQGRRVGALYAGMDDFTYFVPRFPTNYTVSIDGSNIKKTGSFFDVVCDTQYLQGSDFWGMNRYNLFFGGNPGLIQISNERGKKRILVIQDSFGASFSPYFSLSVRQLDVIDLRGFTDSLWHFMEQNHYDLIVVLYGKTVLNIENYLADRLDE